MMLTGTQKFLDDKIVFFVPKQLMARFDQTEIYILLTYEQYIRIYRAHANAPTTLDLVRIIRSGIAKCSL
jgi:hypothetical protein